MRNVAHYLRSLLKQVGAFFYYHTELVQSFRPYNTWHDVINSDTGILSKGCTLNQIIVRDVVYFGQNVGMCVLEADITDPSGVKLPGVSLLRGNSVGMLLIVNKDGRNSVVLVEQARVPTGKFLSEIPAGMVDDEFNLKNVALKETLEEVGIRLVASDLVFLGSAYSSPGGCDENISYFMSYVDCDIDTDRVYGEREEGERIKVRLVPLVADRIAQIDDGKFWTAYGMMKASNLMKENFD